jgi:hypothetical protein
MIAVLGRTDNSKNTKPSAIMDRRLSKPLHSLMLVIIWTLSGCEPQPSDPGFPSRPPHPSGPVAPGNTPLTPPSSRPGSETFTSYRYIYFVADPKARPVFVINDPRAEPVVISHRNGEPVFRVNDPRLGIPIRIVGQEP